MRKLMLFTCGFALAAALWAYVISPEMLLWIGFSAALLIVGLFLLKKKYCIMAAVVLLGLFCGILFCGGYTAKVLLGAQIYDGSKLNARIEATDYAEILNNAKTVNGKILLDGNSYKVKLYFDSSWEIEPGDLLEGEVQLCYTAGSNKSYISHQKADGYYLIAYAQQQLMVTKAAVLPGKYYPAYIQKQIIRRIETIFPQRTMGFAKALLLGDDSDIDFEENTAFQESGIRHIIAVSGLHVSILFSVVFYITGRKRLFTVLVGLPVLLLFAAVTGFTPSVVRACVMQGLMILAVALGKEYDPPTALSFAVLLLLLVNPFVITSVSFQLSVGCMIGIIAFSEPIKNYLSDDKRLGPLKGNTRKAKLKRWFVGSVSVSISAMTVTMPLCAIYFGFISIIGIITNLLTLWVVSTIFCGIIIAVVLSVFYIPLGQIVALIISGLILYVQGVSKLLSGVPFGSAYTESIYTVLWIAVTYLLIVVYLLSKNKKTVLFACSVAALYVLSFLLTWVEPYTDNFRMTVIDVGQGQAVLLQSKSDAYLVDCGGTNGAYTATTVKNTLKSQGVYSLDGVILTHFDKDHCNGLPYLQQIMNVDKLYYPAADAKRFKTIGIDGAISGQQITSSISIPCGKGNIILYPSGNGEDRNDRSMCILFQTENCDILITGDRDITGEGQLLRCTELPDLEILVAGHHGAADATGTELLEHTKPDVAVISVGQHNSYNHPAPQTIERLEHFGCIIRRTDKEGTIIIRG